jgi:hypothetical protein
MFTNLRELIQSMPDENTCREYLVQQRWGGKPLCPYCGCGKTYKIEKGKRYKCGSPDCYKKFSVTVGTVMEASNIPLVKWFTAIYLASAHKKGISSYQLGKDIGVSQKCAWFMLHRIREMMREKTSDKLDNIVEIDECWVGGKVKNMSNVKRSRLRTDNNGTIQNKTMVMGLIERGGNLKLITMGKEAGVTILQPVIKDNVDKDAVVITDSSTSYTGLANDYAGHEIVNHAGDEYVRDIFYTNTIEGAFSMLKRSIIGIYHQVTPKHLSRYCDETMFRYNLRKMKDPQRFIYSLQNIEGRLKYKTLIAAKSPIDPIKSTIPAHNYPKGSILQIKGNTIIANYPTIQAAVNAVSGSYSPLWRVLKGRKKTHKGFEWKYA